MCLLFVHLPNFKTKLLELLLYLDGVPIPADDTAILIIQHYSRVNVPAEAKVNCT